MKRRWAIQLYIIPLLLCLSGCSSGLAANRQDIERLVPVQTMGIDSQGGGVRVSVVSGAGAEEGNPVVFSSLASGIETAMARLQDYAQKDQLYYAHIQYILLGQSAAQEGLPPVLRWVEDSPDMRMDTSMFVVKGEASDAVVTASGGLSDVTEQLASLERESKLQGRHVFTLREIASALAETGCAMCLAVEAVPAAGTVYADDSPSASLLPAGYAVFGNGGLLAGFLTQDASIGAALLAGDAAGAQTTLLENTVELLDGSAEATGQFDGEGRLTGIDIQGQVRAAILEQAPTGDTDLSQLEQALSQAAAQWLMDAIEQAQTMGCDVFDLKDALSYRQEDWAEIFPTLSVTVSMEVTIERG